jgi:hypothetical protein
MKEYFRIDNTEGYSQSQLDELNCMVDERLSNDDDDEEIQSVCESVQKEYDTEVVI